MALALRGDGAKCFASSPGAHEVQGQGLALSEAKGVLLSSCPVGQREWPLGRSLRSATRGSALSTKLLRLKPLCRSTSALED